MSGKRAVVSDALPKPLAPYSHIAIAGGLAFISGLVSQDRATGEFIFDDAASQTRRILENLRALLESIGLALTDVAKITIYLTDMASFGSVNEVYSAFFTTEPPARSCVQVAALPLGASVEIEAIAAV